MDELRQFFQSRWFWTRSLGVVLALAPSLAFLAGVMVEAHAEESTTVAPFLEFMAVAAAALILGYVLTQRGAAEEERERIRNVVREVLQEQRVSLPPVNSIPPSSGEKAEVTELPFMKSEQ